MTPVSFSFFLITLLTISLSTLCFAGGYHVYDWKGAAKEKNGKAVRKSNWQPGFVQLRDGEKQVGEIMVTTVDGRITEVKFNTGGKRKQNFATSELKEFGLLLSVEDLENKRGEPTSKFA